MRSNIVMLLVMAAYFTVADIAYAVWSYIDTGAVEPIGTAAIGLLVVLSIFIAFYLFSGMRRSASQGERTTTSSSWCGPRGDPSPGKTSRRCSQGRRSRAATTRRGWDCTRSASAARPPCGQPSRTPPSCSAVPSGEKSSGRPRSSGGGARPWRRPSTTPPPRISPRRAWPEAPECPSRPQPAQSGGWRRR